MRDLFPQDLVKRWDDALKRSERIVLSTHMNPDGDAVGSLMGLGLFLRQLGFRVSMVCPSPYPGFLKFLDPDREILVFSRNREEVIQKITEADTIIAVDVSSFSRMEELGEILEDKKAFRVLMDHHIDPDSEGFDLVFSTTKISSSCELVYRVLKLWRPESVILKEQAVAFLTGIITDTNQFANSVYPETFNVTSELTACGANTEDIFDKVYRNFSYNRMRLMGYALQNIRLLPQYNAGYIVLTRDVLEEFGYRNGDTEGFVNLPLAITGISVSAFFLQREDHIKVSLRSKGKIAVNGIAKNFFNGGGHYNASAGKMEDAVDKIEELLKKALGTIIA